MSKLKKIIEYGLYLLVFLLPVQTRWIIKAGNLGGYSEYLTISLYGTDILLAVILFLFILNFVKLPKSSTIDHQPSTISPWFFIALIEIGAFISIFFAVDKVSAVFGYARLLLGIGLFWIIYKAEYEKLRFAASFLAGVFLQGLLAIWQFLTQATFASKWLGIASHSQSGLVGESVIETMDSRWLRVYGGLDHPNILGGLLAIGILMMIIVILDIIKKMYDKYSRDKGWSLFPIRKIIAGIFIFYSSLLVLSAGLFFTFSRSAWLSLGAGLSVILIAVIYKKNLIFKIQFLKILFSIGLVFAVLFFIYGDLVQTRTSASGRLEDKSIAERSLYYDDFKQAIPHNLLAGAGLNNYVLVVQKNSPGRPAFDYQPVHNAFLLAWFETGILGLIGYSGLMIYLFILNFKSIGNWKLEIGNLDADKSVFVVFNTGLILALLIIASLDHWLWSLHFGILFFWFIVGYLYREQADA